jgi:hypothetical protein
LYLYSILLFTNLDKEKMKWITKTGQRIAIRGMTNEHLENALAYAKRRNKEGVERMGGSPADIDSMWLELDHHFYDEAIVEFEKEIKKRNFRRMDL